MKKVEKIIFLILIFLGSYVLASSEGVIDPNYKYAWGDYLGWLNFGCDNCQIKITDEKLTGYVWSENYGWINLSPENGGVKNDGEGNLNGYAWGENIGWLDFNGVKIDEQGKFKGKVKSENYGEINFDCNYCEVKTNWRPKRTRGSVIDQVKSTVNQIFGGGGGGLTGPIPPQGGFSVVINNNEPYTYNKIVELTLNGGDFNTYQMAISNFPDFRDAKKEPYQKKKTWDLCLGIENCRMGKYTVYARFFTASAKDFNVTSSIGASPIVSDEIFYLEKGEPTLLPKILNKTSPIVKKISGLAKKVTPTRAQQEIAIAKSTPSKKPTIFNKNWNLLTYTRTEGNLIDFVAPELAGQIKKLLTNFQPRTGSNLLVLLGLANILDLILTPFKSFINFLITLFIIVIVFYLFKLMRRKNQIKGRDSLIIQK